jgi:hypothetical protein
MYHILNFYAIVFSNSFFHEINCEIVKTGMVVLTGREKVDLVDADVAVS